MGPGVQSVFIMDIRLLFLVAIDGCPIAKCGQAFSLFRIPNFIICRIEGLAACIHLCLLPMLIVTESTWHAFCEDK
jgi:hypothetical protein